MVLTMVAPSDCSAGSLTIIPEKKIIMINIAINKRIDQDIIYFNTFAGIIFIIILNETTLRKAYSMTSK